MHSDIDCEDCEARDFRAKVYRDAHLTKVRSRYVPDRDSWTYESGVSLVLEAMVDRLVPKAFQAAVMQDWGYYYDTECGGWYLSWRYQ